MSISVIIPVYNSSVFLPLLFESIKNQKLGNENFEVNFVDNNSTDGSDEDIKAFIDSNDALNLNYLKYNETQSSYAARNFGCLNSNGNVLAFTDADCILHEEWLINIFNFYTISQNIETIIAGDIKLILESNSAIWENFDYVGFLDNEKTFYSGAGGATANLIVPKKVFKDIGEFLPVKSGGDFEWSLRAFERKFMFVFKRDILVYHPTRKTFKEIRKKFLRIAEGRAERYKLRGKDTLVVLAYEFVRIFNVITIVRFVKKLLPRIGLLRTIVFVPGFFLLRIQQFFKIMRTLFLSI
ncbi:MAG: glycosyltransferase family 2 protein [Bacteroidales bacterium]